MQGSSSAALNRARGDPVANLNGPMTKKMTDALTEPIQRCIAAAWVAEQRRLEHERNRRVSAGA